MDVDIFSFSPFLDAAMESKKVPNASPSPPALFRPLFVLPPLNLPIRLCPRPFETVALMVPDPDRTVTFACPPGKCGRTFTPPFRPSRDEPALLVDGGREGSLSLTPFSKAASSFGIGGTAVLAPKLDLLFDGA